MTTPSATAVSEINEIKNEVSIVDELSKFIFTDKYARYDDDLKRRETWEEAVGRVEGMHLKKFRKILPPEDLKKIRWAFDLVREKRVVPSMRSLEDSTPIPTPGGWSTVGELRIGDEIFDQDGNITTILKTYKFEGIDLYDIQFIDGTVIKASADHLWVVSTTDDRLHPKGVRTRIVDTKQIASNPYQATKYNYTVWNPKPLNLPERPLPLDPYILGLWLGNGSSAGGKFAAHQQDGEFIASQYTLAGFSGHKIEPKNPHAWGTFGLTTVLNSIGLLKNKHIPEIYFRASINQRLALIQGFMDSDGCITPEGRCLFSNTNPKIIEGFKELLSSLGIRYNSSYQKQKKSRHKLLTNICFFTNLEISRLQRKRRYIREDQSQRTSHRAITSVTYAGTGNATCFLVDSPSHTYLASKNMIVTHNCMQFGGKAVEVNNLRAYNCTVLHIDRIRAFSEAMFLLLSGCGTGLGLSKQYVDRLPKLISHEDKTGTILTYTIEDTIEGWADSIEALLLCFFKGNAFSGRKITFDYSRIRRKGSRIKIGGGKAPGYAPLKATHTKIKKLLNGLVEDLNQEQLKSINAYDILMHCSDAVLSGGVRRSATLAVFDFDDREMMEAKIGNWFEENPQRGRSNNSTLIHRKDTTFEKFLSILNKTREFGEPGFIFCNDYRILYNPCTEIGFLPENKEGITGVQTCNLTSINGSKITCREDFLEAAEAASLIGTLQATYTDFPYLSKVSEEISKEEALLGVSITGMMQNPDTLFNPEVQNAGAKKVVEINKMWAEKLGINQSSRTTALKPEGSGSIAIGTMTSGIHPAHSHKYFRRVQINKQDPVYQHFKQFNEHACEESIWNPNGTDDVITFPVELDPQVKVKADFTALQHLELIKSTYLNWILPGTTEVNKKDVTHSISCTVLVKENEWEDVIQYLYDNRFYFAAVSLLPANGDKIYKQAPFEAVTTPEDEIRFQKLKESFRAVDYTLMEEFTDETALREETACSGGKCEI